MANTTLRKDPTWKAIREAARPIVLNPTKKVNEYIQFVLNHPDLTNIPKSIRPDKMKLDAQFRANRKYLGIKTNKKKKDITVSIPSNSSHQPSTPWEDAAIAVLKKTNNPDYNWVMDQGSIKENLVKRADALEKTAQDCREIAEHIEDSKH